MAEATYQIKVRDHTGANVALFVGGGRERGGLQSLSYRRRVRTPGGSLIRIDGLDERIDEFLMTTADNAPDYVFEFWRRDLLGGLDWYKDFVVFHRSDEIGQNEEGVETYSARGSGFNVLLQSETIRADVGSTEAYKSGPAETVAKEYVDEQIGPGAVAAQQRQGLTVQVDGGTGANWAGSRANKNLYDVLREIAEFQTADFMIRPTSDANDAITMQFRWYPDQFGLDRTEGNTDGNVPMIFSPDLGNMTNATYRYSRLDEVNVVYVLGQGSGSLRTVVTRTSGTESDSPWNRYAVSRDARRTVDATELNQKGDAVLDKQRAKRIITFDAQQTPASRYGRDWDLGDLVTVKMRGMEWTQKIVGVFVTLDASGNETIKPELQDV